MFRFDINLKDLKYNNFFKDINDINDENNAVNAVSYAAESNYDATRFVGERTCSSMCLVRLR